MESIALKATKVMSALLPQKPSQKSKGRDHSMSLKRRLAFWLEGDINSLILEGRQLLSDLSTKTGRNEENSALARTFSNLIFQGKVKSALKLISQRDRGGFFNMNSLPTAPTRTLLLC